LNYESRATRWCCLAATWLLVAGFLVLHTVEMRDYLQLAGNMGLRGASEATTPLRSISPTFAADAQTWIRYAIELAAGNSFQLHHTDIDNAPRGREVFWNSEWAWTIAGAGWLRHWFTGEAMPTAIERAALWLNLVVLMVLVVLCSLWTARRAGVLWGVTVAFGMLGSDFFYEGFTPSYVDHHGLLAAAVFGLVLGSLFMGAGWWQREDAGDARPLLPGSPRLARRGAVSSALCGSLGMWVSAASLVLPIAIVGAAGLATVLLRGRDLRRSGLEFDAAAWRIWGRCGAALSLVCYLVEFAPAHLGWRLEANHPLYALAWLGGGELVAQLAERWLAEPGRRLVRPWRLLPPALALAAAPLVLTVGGVDVFVLHDPFVVELHRHILEFASAWQRYRLSHWRNLFAFLDTSHAVLLFAFALLCRRTQASNAVLWFAALAAAAFTALGWWQTRWFLTASGPQICLLLAVLATLARGGRQATRLLVVLAATGLLLLPHAVRRIAALHGLNSSATVPKDDGLQPLYRDIAAALRQSQPVGRIVLLASPGDSTPIGYYGRFQTIGTLYWENRGGLKAAAAVFSARSDSEAAEVVRAHGITHLAMISTSDSVASYYAFSHHRVAPEEVRQTFSYRLLRLWQPPPWLEPIPYQVPDDLQPLEVTVLLYKVAWNRPDPRRP